jgi:hypothetical protein
MSYQEKRTIVSIVTGAVILAAYCVFAAGQFQAGPAAAGDLKIWAVAILKFIAIGIAASIIIQIIFHILLSIGVAVTTKMKDADCADDEIERSINAEIVEDEMDKLIELKAMRIGFAAAGIGFILALLALAFNYSPAVMLNILFISFSAGALLEGLAQLVYYHRGV